MQTFQIVAHDSATAYVAPADAPDMWTEVTCSALPAGTRYGDKLELNADGGWVLADAPRSAADDADTLRRLAQATVAAAASMLGLSPSAARAALLALI